MTTIMCAASICWAATCHGAGQLEERLAKLNAAAADRNAPPAKTPSGNADNKPTPDPSKALAEKVETLEEALAALRAELAAVKAGVKVQPKAPAAAPPTPSLSREDVDEIVSKAIEEEKSGATDLPAWMKKVKISGDFRYRHEQIDDETKTSDRDRHRVRARVGLEAKVNDEWDLGFRVASGSADPASTNQTLEDSFSSKDLWLDLAYFQWRPATVSGLKLLGGKIKNPFYKAGKNQLIWDGDLNPEGIAAQHVTSLGERTDWHLNGGGFWVDESSGGVDTSLWGAQTYVKHKFGKSDQITFGASYFDYGNIQGRGDLKSTWHSTKTSFFGNTTNGGAFASDFDILELFGEYGTKAGSLPVTAYGTWVKNVSAVDGEDTGWLVGCKINKAKNPGSWEFGYNYRDIEADAVLGAFNDSDFCGGGTDGKGHKFGLKYQLNKGIQAGLTYLLNEAGADEDEYQRLQADLIAKF